MNPPRYAHSLPGRPPSDWEAVETHSREVSELAARFAEKFGAGPLAALLGRWHDLGKLSEAFQAYLHSATDNDELVAESRGTVDHSTAGGQHLVRILGQSLKTQAFANIIFGHHAGLLDHDTAIEGRSTVLTRLRKTIARWNAPGYEEFLALDPAVLEWAKRAPWAKAVKADYSFGFFIRMVFSCLVDADYLCTERLLSPSKAGQRLAPQSLSELYERFLAYKRTVLDTKVNTPVNRIRREVLEAALARALEAVGLFTFTSPTGSGKTLSSLGFGLTHAVTHGLERVIYVIPYTSTIEQTAQVYREVLGDAVLEHHSNLADQHRTFRSALLSENWDAPVVVTTSVRFFEGLHANRPADARKLHRLSKAVIILDEAQTIPVKYLEPCLKCLQELVARYGSTVVLATATQPALEKTPEFRIGLEGAREIAPEPRWLVQSLRRTKLHLLGPLSRAELEVRLEARPQALCILNTTKAAREVYRSVGVPRKWHLSTRMVPWARRAVLDAVRAALKRREPLALVSTQMVEAGVDLDFLDVFRASCGIDSLGQTDGRCNREGLRPEGHVWLFEDEEPPPRGELYQQAQHGREVLEIHAEDPLGLDAIHRYFQIHYHRQAHLWDHNHILEDLNGPFYNYRSAADRFRYIDEDTRPVVVPLNDESLRLVDRFEGASEPSERRALLRRLQPHSLSVHQGEWEKLFRLGRIRLAGEDLPVLTEPKRHYDPDVGLLSPDSQNE